MAQSPLQPPLWKRVLIGTWLGLSVLGALNHTLLPHLFDRSGLLPALLPHLKWGYVMFNRMPPRVPVVSFLPPGETEYRPLYELNRTPTPGYRLSRASVNYLLRPDYLDYLCRTSPKAQGALFRLQVFEVTQSQKLLGTAYRTCRDGVFHDETVR